MLIEFSGSASDTQDGDLSGKIVWSSSLTGQLATGSDFFASLVAGTHIITAKVVDAAGLSATATVTVTVTNPNTPPSVAILSPSNGSVIGQTVGFTFSGTASDREDGDISWKIVWTSSLDGSLGTGGSVTANLSPGTHTITAAVTDSGGATTRSSVSVVVPNPTLIVSVTTDRTAYMHRDTVNITVGVTTGSGPVANASVSVVITTAGGKTSTLVASTDAAGRAAFQYQINSKRDGVGTYTVRASASRSGYSSGTAAYTSFTVTK
jgi:hypothetical protein